MTNEYVHPDMLVETDWLASHIDDSNIKIVDCDPFDSYKRAHIEGAVGIKVHHYIKQAEYDSDSHNNPLVAPPDRMKEIMEDMGISDSDTVVAYDSSGCLWATRFWWVLNYYGHSNVKVLNGGWKKWLDEGRSITDITPDRSGASFTPKVREELVCTLDYAINNLENKEVLFLDVRADSEWDGTNDRGNNRSGHVPGAVHLEWLNFITDDRHQTIKPASELRELLSSVGATPDKEIVAY